MPTASLMTYLMGLDAAKSRPATSEGRPAMRRYFFPFFIASGESPRYAVIVRKSKCARRPRVDLPLRAQAPPSKARREGW